MIKKTLTAMALAAAASLAGASVVNMPSADKSNVTFSQGWSFDYGNNQSFAAKLMSGQTYTITFDVIGGGETNTPALFTKAWVDLNGDRFSDDALGGVITFDKTTRATGTFTFTVPTLTNTNGRTVADRVFFNLNSRDADQGGYRVANISISPVPEPASTALFLAGLGAVGLLARRRRA